MRQALMNQVSSGGIVAYHVVRSRADPLLIRRQCWLETRREGRTWPRVVVGGPAQTDNAPAPVQHRAARP